MEENEQNEQNEQKDLRQDAVDTFNKTKENIKNMDIKEEFNKGKGLISRLLLNPIDTIKEVVADENNQFFKTAIFIIAVWIVAVGLRLVIYNLSNKYFNYTFLEIIKNILSPILRVLIFAVIIHILNKSSKKSLPKTISASTVAYIPVIISAILVLLKFIGDKVYYVTDPITLFLGVIATVLRFFVTKEVLDKEDNNEALKEFIKVEGIYYICYFLLNFLGISI